MIYIDIYTYVRVCALLWVYRVNCCSKVAKASLYTLGWFYSKQRAHWLTPVRIEFGEKEKWWDMAPFSSPQSTKPEKSDPKLWLVVIIKAGEIDIDVE